MRIYLSSLVLVAFLASVVRADLVHRYSFNNGDLGAIDSVGGQNGTLQGGATISGNAVQLDGSNDYVNLPGGLITGYTALTFEAWFTCSASNGIWTRIWDFGDTNPSTGNGRDYVFFTPKSWASTFRYAISDADPGFDHEESIETSPTATGVPVYVAVVHNSTTGEVELYVNGIPASSGTFSIPLSAVNNVYSYLGKSLYADPYLTGSIDEFRIYSSALTPGQIAQHYAYGPDFIGESLLVIQESNGVTEVIEGNSTPDTYTVALSSQPTSSVTLKVDPDEQLDIGNGRGGPVIILFTPPQWNIPQTVTVWAYDDDVLEADPHTGIITHSISSSDPNFNNKPLLSINVTIWEDECGTWGYNYADLNYDCAVNFEDFVIFASYWLSSFNPITLETMVSDWLKTTQPYAPNAQNGPVPDSPDELFIEPNEIVCQIDEKVYGHFLEHIYHSANGGLWGELVWNRSLEDFGGGGSWSIEGDELVQSSLATDVHMEFDDITWTNYEYTLQAKKDSGSEGFLILFRAPDNDNFYWLNLGGWQNDYHAIEKEVNGGRSVVTSQIAGSINSGQWYTIRIRCEGNNFQVWLDGSPLFNYTDTSNPHLSGEVGVGTWSTAARFRNIVVKDLSNNTLFSGLPEVEGTEGIPEYWSDYGTGSFYFDSNALNNDYSLRVENDDGSETGIEQTPFNIIPQQYTGSIWARKSEGAMTAVVRLLDGEDVLGQTVTPALTENWVEYPFTFNPAQSAENAMLQVGVTGIGAAYIDQISMMGQDANATGGYRPDLLQAIDDLHPPCIRWPGGCFASLYLWKDGIGPQSQRFKYPAYMWDDQDVSSYGTDEFLRMCEILGVEPIIVINTGRTDSACGGTAQWKLLAGEYLQYAMDWVEYCNGSADSNWGSVRAANGHPEPYNVKYWEIDNETWWMGDTSYSATVNQFAPALKAVDQTIKIIACGSGGLGSQSWNQTVINNCANVMDYISIHHYEGSSGYQSGPPAFESFIEDLGDIIAASSNPDIKIDASEWNLQTTDWRTGLYAGGLLNVFERTGYVFEIGGPALFLRHTSATAWDNAFINFDHTGWFPAPNYVVMKLWHDNYAPYRISMTGPVGNLNAIATKSADGSKIYFKVVNPTDQSVPVKLVISDTFDVSSVSLQLVAPDSLSARNTLDNPNAVHVEDGYAGLNGQIIRFAMPRLSAGVVKISREQ